MYVNLDIETEHNICGFIFKILLYLSSHTS